jgi:hypothetical protein
MALRGECYGSGAALLLEAESQLGGFQEAYGSHLGRLEVGKEQGVVVTEQGP